jgi:hypothetical protein
MIKKSTFALPTEPDYIVLYQKNKQGAAYVRHCQLRRPTAKCNQGFRVLPARKAHMPNELLAHIAALLRRPTPHTESEE